MTPNPQDDIRSQLASAGVGLSGDPDSIRIGYIGHLADKTSNPVMSDLQDREIITMALFAALDTHLKTKDDMTLDAGLPAINVFFDEIIRLRVSKDRLGRKELVECIKQASRIYNYGAGIQNQEEQSFWSKLMFWRRGQ